MSLPAPAEPVGDGRYRCDVVIVGAGAAGLYAVTSLPDGLDVIVVDKGSAGLQGSSPWAQGGVAVALGPDDSPALHAADTLRAGDGLCDPLAVNILTTEAPGDLANVLAMGAAFDRQEGRDGSMDLADLHLAREGGMSVARSVHKADATGAELVRVLRAAASPKVTRLAGTATALATDAVGAVAGLVVLAGEEGPVLVEAKAVLLATGGCGGLFAATTNPANATADGMAIAHLAGAAVRDTEFVQFHPTGLAVEGSWRFLLTEALRGAGATLHATDGTRFMPALHPDAELAPRHVVAKAILDQEDGMAWLDATSIPQDVLDHEFPTVLEGASRVGFDLAGSRVPVTPAAHYMVGGVRTDVDGRTSLPGLYAAGEVASTGLHGANRKASNSLAEAMVYGRRAAHAMVRDLPEGHREATDVPLPTADGPDAATAEVLADRIRQTMWRGAGPARTGESLAATAEELEVLAKEVGDAPATAPAAELALGLHAAGLIVAGARLREESRGGHYRLDHPDADPAWAARHIEHIRL